MALNGAGQSLAFVNTESRSAETKRTYHNETYFDRGKMSEATPAKTRTVLIAIDGSEHSKYAFECKYYV